VLSIHWFLPTGGDSREVVPASPDAHRRAPTLPYLAQVAQAAEQLGFDGLLTPCGTACEDAWVATAMLIGLTSRIRFLVAFRPGLLSPTLAAQMASTYQRLSGGRLLLNVVTGAEASELARFGDWADKDARYARTAEFLEVLQGSWNDEPFDFDGDHYRVARATTRAVPNPRPEVYFGGASAAAEAVAARWVDVYLAWGEPPAMVADRVERVRQLARSHGRSMRFGIRFHVITRPTAAAAWQAASQLIEGMEPEAIAAARADFASTESEGQRRMATLHDAAEQRGDDVRSLEVHPNVWAGVGLVRGGAGTALVGSHEEVADRIVEYHDLGFDEFILSGYPHLEEAFWVGEGVLPMLADRGLIARPGQSEAPAPVSTFR